MDLGEMRRSGGHVERSIPKYLIKNCAINRQETGLGIKSFFGKNNLPMQGSYQLLSIKSWHKNLDTMNTI